MKTHTIFAQSTGRGKAGVAVIRISGADALSIAQKLTSRTEFEPNKMYLCELIATSLRAIKDSAAISRGIRGLLLPPEIATATSLPRNDVTLHNYVIDRAMVVYFKTPNSFTGEDIVELHTHGSIAVIRILTATLLEMGLRLAEPGEFSKRAFLNGKMDLTSAEGLADLIDSETEMQHRQAMRHMSGEFEELCDKWRGELLKSLSLLEAYIDFPDEEVPASVLNSTQEIITNLSNSLEAKLQDNRRGERLRHGITMAVLGEPNVGKSTLMNFLSQRDVSIISDIAGTTRDVVETHLDIGGYPIILADTAGLRKDVSDIVEKEGVNRAMKAAQMADIKLVMIDARKLDAIPEDILGLIDDSTIVLVNKIDLVDSRHPHDALARHGDRMKRTSSLPQSPSLPANSRMTDTNNLIHISVKSRIGMDDLINAITAKAEAVAGIGEDIRITRERHRNHITKALAALRQCDIKSDLVLAAEDLRIAARSLSLLTGKIEVEEILGEIFANFCIGK